MFRILLTRPLAQSSEFSRTLMDLGICQDVIATSPILEITNKTDWNLPKSEEILLFTSANGVRAAVDLKGRKAVCVGRSTTSTAQEAGFEARFGGENVEALKNFLTTEDGPFCHLRGAHTVGNLTTWLLDQGKLAREIVVYEQNERPLTAAHVRLLEGGTPVVLPLFSARSAELTLNTSVDWSRHCAVAISSSVAEICKRAGFGRVSVAERPNTKSMAKMTLREYDRLMG